MKNILLPVAFAMMLLSTSASETLNLSGEWKVELDRSDVGQKDKWFSRELSQKIELPGSLQTARIGDPITLSTKWTGGIFDQSYFKAPQYERYRQPDNIKVPFWLQPETHYVGAAWYQKTFTLPPEWIGQRVTLTLERPHWTTTVWLDDKLVGSSDANSVAHVFELPAPLSSGQHRLSIRVDNRLVPDIGENSHSVSDHTQGNWNGIVGRIELRATPPIWVEPFTIESRVADRTAIVRGKLGKTASQTFPKSVTVSSPSLRESRELEVDESGNFQSQIKFGRDAALWDEFTPMVHRLKVSIPGGHALESAFGFRDVIASGRQLQINGRPLFLRGTLDCAIFPKTGHPPTDTDSWTKIFRVIKDHGLNHVRFHSWCPPEAAFVAADAIGLYLQVEVASWPNWSTTLGDGKPVDGWIDAETDRILKAYGNHPSFLILCAGNEPAGEKHEAWLGKWVSRQKTFDPRRLYSAGAGWPQIPENDLHIPFEPRIYHWGRGLKSRINANPPETRTDYVDYIREQNKPLISHEIGQWCVYPNLKEMSKYTGYLKPKNFEIFHDSLAAKGMLDQAHDFLIASGKLQLLCYKEEVESALRTPEMGGFQLLSLQDFPGQGTALVGILDAFWDQKGYVTPDEFRRFSGSSVPLARLDKRVFTTDEFLVADVEIAHFGSAMLKQQRAGWKLVAQNGTEVAAGEFNRRDIPVAAGVKLGRIDLSLADLPVPSKFRLLVELPGTTIANDWDVWVYPPARNIVEEAPKGVTVTAKFDSTTLSKLEKGETVWLMAGADQVLPDPNNGPVSLGFSSVFWNTAWTNGQPPHTLGVLCDPKHPALVNFLTEPYSNWQWWYAVTKAGPMILDTLPRELKPIVQVVDDWFTNRKLGLVFEARVGKGRLLVSSIDFSGAVLDPVRRQLRFSLLRYLQSKAFDPTTSLNPEDIRRVLKDPTN